MFKGDRRVSQTRASEANGQEGEYKNDEKEFTSRCAHSREEYYNAKERERIWRCAQFFAILRLRIKLRRKID